MTPAGASAAAQTGPTAATITCSLSAWTSAAAARCLGDLEQESELDLAGDKQRIDLAGDRPTDDVAQRCEVLGQRPLVEADVVDDRAARHERRR